MGILRFLAAFSVGALCALGSEDTPPLSSTPVPGDDTTHSNANDAPTDSAVAQGDGDGVPKNEGDPAASAVTGPTAASEAQDNEAKGTTVASGTRPDEATPSSVAVPDNRVGSNGDAVREVKSSGPDTPPASDSGVSSAEVEQDEEDKEPPEPLTAEQDPQPSVEHSPADLVPPMEPAGDSFQTGAGQDEAGGVHRESAVEATEESDHEQTDATEHAGAPKPSATKSPSTALRSSTNGGGAERVLSRQLARENDSASSSSTETPPTEPTNTTTTTTTTTTTLPEQDAGASGVSPALTGLTTFAIAILGSTAVAIAAL